jgi:hypothetical protein
MTCFLRRFLVLTALMFWQGGFLFYAAVVVPTGQSVLGSHLEQGMITRQVTIYLNLAGCISLFILGWDIRVARDASRTRRLGRWASWFAMAVLLVALLWLHGRLDSLIDLEAHELREPRAFRAGHRAYLWLSTLQWVAGVAFTGLTLQAWRSEDRFLSAAGR